MEIKAQAKYLRLSPRKTRLVVDLIRGEEVLRTLDLLRFTNKSAARAVTKLLNSAIANAENNYKLKRDNLYIKKAVAEKGPVLKRWKPRAFGRATPVLKRLAHISLVLEERLKSRPAKVSKKVDSAEGPRVVKPEEVKQAGAISKSNQPKDTKPTSPASRQGFVKKIFSRKTV